MRYPAAFVSFCVALAIGAAGCSSISYNADFDPAAPYDSYQTYEWLETVVPSAELDRGLDPLVERRFVNRIESELEGKGYQKPTSAAPDFVVNFRLATQEKVDVRSYYSGWGYYPYGGMQTQARQWTEGTLLIEVIDVRSEQVVWQGWAQGALQQNPSPEQVTKAVDEIVSGILGRFPPTQD